MRGNVLVIGGAGYIGSHTCLALAENGYQPLAYDDLSLGHIDFVQWGPLLDGDIRDTSRLTAAIRENAVVGVMHFAALAAVGESVLDPAKYYGLNVAGTWSVLEALRATGGPPLVFSSSCAIYGEPSEIPIREEAPKTPINPYGRSKLFCEAMMGDYATAYGQPSIALRYFNAAGADPKGRVGERRHTETHLIPNAMAVLLGRSSTFEVFGDDFDTPDGTAVRDYTHVSDLADAHVAALGLLLQGHRSDAFNLGTGSGTSVTDVLNAIERVSGLSIQKVKRRRRAGDPAVLIANPGRAVKALGFVSSRSDLDTIIKTAWQWHSAHDEVQRARHR